jgi:cytochrome c5
MIQRWKQIVGSSFLIAALLGIAWSSVPASGAAPASQDKKAAAPTPPSNGERAFQQNCGRCHSTPQGFSPQISGTVVRHMRVRASLSREDERAILKYLNP